MTLLLAFDHNNPVFVLIVIHSIVHSAAQKLNLHQSFSSITVIKSTTYVRPCWRAEMFVISPKVENNDVMHFQKHLARFEGYCFLRLEENSALNYTDVKSTCSISERTQYAATLICQSYV